MVHPAVLYHPDGYSTSGTRLIGRRVAGRDFLRAHFEAATAAAVPRLSCHAPSRDLAVEFAREGRRAGYPGKTRLVGWDEVAHLADDRVLYLPDPGLATHAAFRERAGRAAYSLSGVIHTLASGPTLDLVSALATAPIAPWDALVCTSHAGRSVVTGLLDAAEAWLAERVGATRFTRPELPIIPLGVHIDDYAGLREDKRAARAALGLPPDAKVVVFVGRLSLHAKAHPLPLYLALDRAAATVGPIVLLECGSFGDASAAPAFAAMRAAFPRLLGGVVGGDTPASDDQKLACLAAADAFVSLADNVQETFGLSVVEAMAAGLPVVVSDWDGYKDTVRDGVDGYRIPTALPATGAARELVWSYDRGELDFDHFVGYLSQHCAVDIDAAAQAFTRLLSDPAHAAELGANATRRAEDFRWSSVYTRYQALWDELDARRLRHLAGGDDPPRPLPGRPEAEVLYAAFPTRTTTLATRWHRPTSADTRVLGLDGVMTPLAGVIDGATCTRLLAALEAGPRSTLELAAALASPGREPEPARVSGQLHALWKYGLVAPLD